MGAGASETCEIRDKELYAEHRNHKFIDQHGTNHDPSHLALFGQCLWNTAASSKISVLPCLILF